MKKLLFGIAFFLVPFAVADAQEITYNLVSYPTDQEGYSLSGSIVTDGTIGALSTSNIVSWSWEIDQNAVGGELWAYSGNSSSYNFATRGVIATPTQLLLPLGNYPPLSDYNVISMPSDPQGADGVDWVNSNVDFAPYAPYYIGNAFQYGGWHNYAPQMGGTEPWVVAQTATVPEPSTFALLSVGVTGLLGYAWRRRSIQESRANRESLVMRAEKVAHK